MKRPIANDIAASMPWPRFSDSLDVGLRVDGVVVGVGEVAGGDFFGGEVGVGVLDGGGGEAHEQGGGVEGSGSEFGVELSAEEVGVLVVGQFEDLHDGLVGVSAGEDEAVRGEFVNVLGVDLVAMSEATADSAGVAEEHDGAGVGGDLDVFAAEAHVAAESFDFLLFGEDVDDGAGGVGVEFRGGGVGHAADVAGVFDDGHLEAETDTEVGGAVLAGVSDAGDFGFGAARAESTGDDDAVEGGEQFGDGFGGRIEFTGVDPLDVDVGVEVGAAVFDGFVDGGVGIAEGGVLAGDADFDLMAMGVGELLDESSPLVSGLVFGGGSDAGVHVEQGEDFDIEGLAVHVFGDGVDRVAIVHGEDASHGHVGEHGDFFADGVVDLVGGAAGDHVGLDAELHHAFDAELGGL